MQQHLSDAFSSTQSCHQSLAWQAVCVSALSEPEVKLPFCYWSQPAVVLGGGRLLPLNSWSWFHTARRLLADSQLKWMKSSQRLALRKSEQPVSWQADSSNANAVFHSSPGRNLRLTAWISTMTTIRCNPVMTKDATHHHDVWYFYTDSISLHSAVAQEVLPMCEMWQKPGVDHSDWERWRDLL